MHCFPRPLPKAHAQVDGFGTGYHGIRVDGARYPDVPSALQCLIQGDRGFGGPVRYLWQDSADLGPCGMASLQAFIENGQGLYTFKYVGYGGTAGERGLSGGPR